MADLNDERPLRTLSEVYKELAATIDSKTADVEVTKFAHAFSLISPFFRYFGLALKFAEIDVVAKVNNITEASKSISTLEALLERDIKANTVRKVGSHSRNLLKAKRAVDMVRAFLENILATEYAVNTLWPTNLHQYLEADVLEPLGRILLKMLMQVALMLSIASSHFLLNGLYDFKTFVIQLKIVLK
ncbi:hypothetical protein CJ030_MR4G026804 [Morella rubra]|uniref:Glycolipid transfer protein domain-containing protein n=1 Tax=Morella rubra TaxID=262757 RepID=A0A6A1VTH0_9ROSI|nr:hypothetical protein CJ030_MR0G008576 [Morella rubra]KAB1216219.1 hypothetical protein CJ030_MR4G026804 [Morella rubra]